MKEREAFTKKNLKLGSEFDRYLIEHDDVFEKLPRKSQIIITTRDKKFNAWSLELAAIHTPPKGVVAVEAHKERGKWDVRPLALQAA